MSSLQTSAKVGSCIHPHDPTQAPEIVDLYALNTPPSYVRYCLRQKFEANRHVTNPKAIDVLILKGRQEYQETMNGWKMIDQVYGLLLDGNVKRIERSRKGFLERFYEGKYARQFDDLN